MLNPNILQHSGICRGGGGGGVGRRANEAILNKVQNISGQNKNMLPGIEPRGLRSIPRPLDRRRWTRFRAPNHTQGSRRLIVQSSSSF